ncbi:hypothetical protein BEN49_13770 [Hymenobacter coccineus]|uniref:Uncharacterized protein n=1 Tax=Hymenobacter coccineus TaxID=1908235 RepID=A0A1G1SV50_9BACT|nr:hypothetical protein BEN49_13770 [Hymenobacter coccineus]
MAIFFSEWGPGLSRHKPRRVAVGGGGFEEEVGEVLLHLAQQRGVEAVADGEPVNLAADQVQRLQLLQVLRHGGARQRQLGRDVAGNARLLTGQQLNDGHPRRVGQRLGHAGQLLLVGSESSGFGVSHRAGFEYDVNIRHTMTSFYVIATF